MIENTAAQDQAIATGATKTYWKMVLGLLGVSVVVVSTWVLASADTKQSINRDDVLIAVIEEGEFYRDVVASGRIVAANAPTVFSTTEAFISCISPSELRITSSARII